MALTGFVWDQWKLSFVEFIATEKLNGSEQVFEHACSKSHQHFEHRVEFNS